MIGVRSRGTTNSPMPCSSRRSTNSSASLRSRPLRAGGRCWAHPSASCRPSCHITTLGSCIRLATSINFPTNLIKVLDSGRYRENAERHRREILLSYDWRSISMRTEEIYRRAAAGHQ